MLRRLLSPAALLFLLLPSTGLVARAESPADKGVTADGMLVSPLPTLGKTSPAGLYSLRMLPVEVGFDQFRVDLEVTSPDGVIHRLRGLEGNGFFVSDLGRVIVLQTAELSSLPSTLGVYDLDGRRLWTGTLEAPSNPTLSRDGGYLACGVREGTVVMNLRDFSMVRYPHLDLFAVGAGGLLAGISYRDHDALVMHVNGDAGHRIPMDFRARTVGIAPDQASVFVLGPAALVRVPVSINGSTLVPASPEVAFQAPAGSDLRDLRVSDSGIEIGARRFDGQSVEGERIILDASGRVSARLAGPARPVTRAEGPPAGFRGIPWPIAPDTQHPVGNTYGEYQNYGGAPYPHPGFDCMGSPFQPVFAVRSGVVKAILTTSGEWHWRVAVADSAIAGTGRGYLYAHLNQSSITVNVGDVVTAGEQLGTLVTWPNDNFNHCHFTRIEDSGATWDGYWLSVQNPHIDVNHTETSAPVFLPARGTSLLAFCNNNTSSYQLPTALHGAVDIIARVYDQIATTWKCSVQELRYTIYPLGQPNAPVVNDKQSVFFNMTLDTYAAGTIDAFLINLLYKQDTTCQTKGDYTYREFYHILTNSNGDQVYDQADVNEAWNTALLPDGNYVIRVRAVDAAGNARADSMVVTTVNGNPSAVGNAVPDLAAVTCRPNPAFDRVTLSFTQPAAGPAILSLYSPDGRLVRRIDSGARAAGGAEQTWDLRDAHGKRVAAGTYFYRLEAGGAVRSGNLTVVR